LRSTEPLASAYVRAFGEGLGVGGKSGHVMNVFQYIWQNHGQVLELTLEHLRLVGFSTLFAMLIGIPLGIAIAHSAAI
jgi:ABC-type proline/glycine betaine transport system permease subunit